MDEVDLNTDFEAAVSLLEREAGPAFSLPANRFHVHKAKAEDKGRRRGIKNFIRPENARCILPHLPVHPDDRTHCALRGDFVLGDLIPLIIRERGRCPHLHVATLGMSVANAASLADLVARALVGELTLICSAYFAQVDKVTTFQEVQSRLAGVAEIRIERCHAKVICLPTAAGDSFVLEGSANLRSSDNLEQMVIVNDPDTLAFHVGWMKEVGS